jgi:hypothetical protein
MQKSDTAALCDLVEAATHLDVRARARKETAHERAIIKTCAPHDNRPPPALINLFNGFDRIARVSRRRVFVSRLDNVDQMMRNTAALRERHFVGADVESAIYRGRVAADDFAAAPQCELDAERALARGGRTEDGEYRRPFDLRDGCAQGRPQNVST